MRLDTLNTLSKNGGYKKIVQATIEEKLFRTKNFNSTPRLCLLLQKSDIIRKCTGERKSLDTFLILDFV